MTTHHPMVGGASRLTTASTGAPPSRVDIRARPVLEKNILSALDSLYTAVRPHLEAEIRQAREDNYIAPVPEAFSDAPEPHGPGIPLFGWRLTRRVSSDSAWEDVLDVALWNSSIAIGDWSGLYDQIDEIQQDGFTDLLHHHGVPAVRHVQEAPHLPSPAPARNLDHSRRRWRRPCMCGDRDRTVLSGVPNRLVHRR
ncbi:hypothetical protein [Streptomyces sp. NPDC057496]|uniref:hypothetical protein n=1 Tax=Streptomyces sp. NPDC057496 TaxID=3346149 RepID=UPI003694D494